MFQLVRVTRTRPWNKQLFDHGFPTKRPFNIYASIPQTPLIGGNWHPAFPQMMLQDSKFETPKSWEIFGIVLYARIAAPLNLVRFFFFSQWTKSWTFGSQGPKFGLVMQEYINTQAVAPHLSNSLKVKSLDSQAEEHIKQCYTTEPESFQLLPLLRSELPGRRWGVTDTPWAQESHL